MSYWNWPLKNVFPLVPVGDHDGAFGKKRRFDTHTGVDLYCPSGTEVVAVEDGEVVGVEVFTGPLLEAGSPWWRTTYAVLVEGASGVILYGEVIPNVTYTTKVRAGDTIGYVERVRKYRLKNLFNWKPHSMLHLELYWPGTTKSVWWWHGEKMPLDLRDPTNHLQDAQQD